MKHDSGIPNSRTSQRDRRASSARQRLAEFLDHSDAAGVVLTTPAAVAWATGAFAPPVDRSAAIDGVWVVVSATTSAILTSEVEADRVLDEYEPKTHGFELVAVPWFDPDALAGAAAAVAGAPRARLASDGHPSFGLDADDELTALRLALSEDEQAELTSLGGAVARALGSSLRDWTPGAHRDLDVQAQLIGLLEAEGADTPVVIVGGDERLRRFRHPLAVGAMMHDSVMAVVVARRFGLHVAATRFAYAHDLAPEEKALRERVEAVDDAVLAASRAGASYGDALQALERAYFEVGAPGAWREHYQGGPIGFRQREFEIAPCQHDSRWYNEKITSGHALAWNPSLAGGAKVEDTYLVSTSGLTRVTDEPDWPVALTPMQGRTRPLPLVVG